jgi:hypothetical protein
VLKIMLLVQGLKLCPILGSEIVGMPLLPFSVVVGRGLLLLSGLCTLAFPLPDFEADPSLVMV